MMTPWSTEVDALDHEHVRVAVILSLDKGPMRQFRPFLDVVLDEAHAIELLGRLWLALHDMRQRRAILLESTNPQGGTEPGAAA